MGENRLRRAARISTPTDRATALGDGRVRSGKAGNGGKCRVHGCVQRVAVEHRANVHDPSQRRGFGFRIAIETPQFANGRCDAVCVFHEFPVFQKFDLS